MTTIIFRTTRLLLAAFAAALLFIGKASAQGQLTATIDRSEITIEETLTLRLRYYGDTAGEPDISALKVGFEVLGNRRSSQYRNYNGQVESFTEWLLTLAPKREGKLTIPPISYAGHKTPPLDVQVNPPGALPEGANREAFLEVETDKEQVRVGEQLLVKVRLYTSVSLHSLDPSPLDIPNAQVEKVTENRYDRHINNVGYAVYEIVFAVFPEKPGPITIPALTYHALTGDRDPFSIFNRSSKRMRLRSTSKNVMVMPRPDSYSGEHWLPARSLGIAQAWSKDPKEFKVGEPITRILTVTGEGLKASQLPPIPRLSVDGLKTYPDQPQKEDTTSMQGITGVRTETTAIVASQPGDYALPAVTITWWDTEAQQQRAAYLPPFTFTVTGGQTIAPAEGAAAETGPLTTAQQEIATADNNWLWRALAIGSLIANLALAGLIIWLWRGRIRTNFDQATTEEPEPAALPDLETAAASGDAANLQPALLAWAQRQPGVQTGDSLSKAAQRSNNPDFSKLVVLLEQALFAEPARPLNSHQVQILISRLEKDKSNVAGEYKNKPTLSELYQ
ncbi:BatD family protein [Biformimicrobium ophioploci]|uniref:BatD family protein n=1 Tax=Biformimicrobium ophioploci TaxID=3036711 RepID=UPI0025574761|nr:BatD family protein [Microbulbifer sp. NKW57]